jgi:hypothetical protein
MFLIRLPVRRRQRRSARWSLAYDDGKVAITAAMGEKVYGRMRPVAPARERPSFVGHTTRLDFTRLTALVKAISGGLSVAIGPCSQIRCLRDPSGLKIEQ